MRVWGSIACTLLLLNASPISAGMNRSYMVPAYASCRVGVCPATLESSFRFDQAILFSSPGRYTGPGKLAILIELKGVRDAGGALVTTDPANADDDFLLVVPESQVTLLSGAVVGTLSPGLSGDVVYRFDLTKGRVRKRFNTPDITPERGLVTQVLGNPVVLDNEGNRLAVTGARTKP
jgi:hypothetical protein